MTAGAATFDRPLTPQQRAALEARDVSVSLAAGAGCGKTFVLTERFISHLDPTAADDAAELDQLVAITFTDAAAREMRDRIRRRCLERLQTAADRGEAAAWQRLMRSIDAARISTIHAFCGALLRAHAVEAGLDPQFEVLDAPAADLLRLETVDDRLRALLVARDEDVLNLAAKRGLDRLRTDLRDFTRPRCAQALAQWREATPEQLVACWLQFFENEAGDIALAELVNSGEFLELKRLADPTLAATDRLRGHLGRLAEALADLELRRRPPGEAAAELRTLARVQGVCAAKDWNDPDDYARFRDAAKGFREERIDKSILQADMDMQAAHEAAGLGLALVRLAADISESLEAVKARRNQLEFDDLLVRAHRLLTAKEHQELRQRATRGVRLMMVDEFQDTNPLQTDIITEFCGADWRRRGLFAVGDLKQSIYRFNGAEPRVSTKLRGELPEEGRKSLTTNFRSQPAVLDFVNAVFSDSFADYEPLVPSRPQTTEMPAVEFLWSPGPHAAEGDDKAEQPPPKRPRRGATRDARAEEARWIARRLRQLLDSQTPIVVEDADGEPTPRAVRPGDVAILLRALGDSQAYEEALRDEGIEYYLAGGHAFYSQQEIFDVLNLLSAVVSGLEEIALAGALRSPIFALADETLFWLVTEHGGLNAALAADEPPPQLSAAEAAKVRRAAATLARLRREKDRLLVAELMELALELTGYDAVLLCEFLGSRKASNVAKLVEQARAHDRTSPGDLPGFVTQLAEFVVRAPKEALAATHAEGDVVRIMTIHHAKGLEFPVVVLPDLERGRHGRGGEPVLDVALGPLVPAPDSEGWVGLDLYRRIDDLEELAERKRLLYVGCTRAADYLMLSSSIDDLEKPKSDWLQLVDRTVSLSDGALRRRLPEGYGVPRVRVTVDEPPASGDAGDRSRGPDLERLVAKTRSIAAEGGGRLPAEAAAIPPDAGAKRRFSFSWLSGKLVAGPPPSSSRGVIERAATGDYKSIEFGRLIHAALEQIDYRDPGDVRGLCEFLAPQFAPGAPGRAAARATEMIQRFLGSPGADDLARARTVRREVEFVLPWPPVGDGFQGRYLQGYLDCLYQDEFGQWRLLDFKSNQMTRDDVSQVVDQYELQMLAYSLACERALGEPLASCALELLAPGVEYNFSWDQASRRQKIDRITAAMTAAPASDVAADFVLD